VGTVPRTFYPEVTTSTTEDTISTTEDTTSTTEVTISTTYTDGLDSRTTTSDVKNTPCSAEIFANFRGSWNYDKKTNYKPCANSLQKLDHNSGTTLNLSGSSSSSSNSTQSNQAFSASSLQVTTADNMKSSVIYPLLRLETIRDYTQKLMQGLMSPMKTGQNISDYHQDLYNNLKKEQKTLHHGFHQQNVDSEVEIDGNH